LLRVGLGSSVTLSPPGHPGTCQGPRSLPCRTFVRGGGQHRRTPAPLSQARCLAPAGHGEGQPGRQRTGGCPRAHGSRRPGASLRAGGSARGRRIGATVIGRLRGPAQDTAAPGGVQTGLCLVAEVAERTAWLAPGRFGDCPAGSWSAWRWWRELSGVVVDHDQVRVGAEPVQVLQAPVFAGAGWPDQAMIRLLADARRQWYLPSWFFCGLELGSLLLLRPRHLFRILSSSGLTVYLPGSYLRSPASRKGRAREGHLPQLSGHHLQRWR
jgi:hypothetical protein